MVTVRGACDKLFWIYKWLNNRAAPRWASDDVLVVEDAASYILCDNYHKTVMTCSGWGQRYYSIAYLIIYIYILHDLLHAPRTFAIRLSAPNTTRYEVSFSGEPSL